jgi:hypothetical protein
LLLTDRDSKYDRHWFENWEELPDDMVEFGERFRLLHFVDGDSSGRVRTIDLPVFDEPVRSVVSIGGDQFLVFYRRDSTCASNARHHDARARVIDATGAVLSEFVSGSPLLAQAAPGGPIWLGYEGSDERIFSRYEWLEDANVRCVDSSGLVLFDLNEVVVSQTGIPKVSFVQGLNVVSDREVWISYTTIDRKWPTYFFGLLGHILDGDLVGLWPWTRVSYKAPIFDEGREFAIIDNHLLVKGIEHWHPDGSRESPNRDDDRLYLVSLTTPRSLEIFPIDEHGDWIGPFRTEGRGSKLFLTTEHALFMIDAAALLP